jgi:hypothetical protein
MSCRGLSNRRIAGLNHDSCKSDKSDPAEHLQRIDDRYQRPAWQEVLESGIHALQPLQRILGGVDEIDCRLARKSSRAASRGEQVPGIAHVLLTAMAAATTRNRYQRLANTNVQVCQLATWATIVRAIATHQN